MMWGDTVMCNHLSQVSQLKGDYKPAAYDVWSIEEPIIAALQSSAVTWAVVAPLVLGAFALLVCNGTLDAAGFTNSVSFTGVSSASVLETYMHVLRCHYCSSPRP